MDPNARLGHRLPAVLCGVILTGMVLGSLLQEPLRQRAWSSEGWADYVINQQASSTVITTGTYPGNFVYPVPYVIVQDLLRKFAPFDEVIWTALIALMVAVCSHTVLRSYGLPGWKNTWPAILLAYLGARYFVNWDLASSNCNLIYLALVCGSIAALVGDKEKLAGLLLAASIATKLYSVLLVPYWIWRGRLKAVAATATGGLLFFVLLPAVYCGPDRAISMTQSWLQAVRQTGDPQMTESFVAYLVSLHKTVMVLLGPEGTWYPLSKEITVTITRMLQMLWMTLLAGYFLYSKRAGESVQRWWCDSAVLLMATLPLTPLLQPHQGAVLFAATLLIAYETLNPQNPARQRYLFAGILASFVLLQELGPAGPVRGLGIMIQVLVTPFALLSIVRNACAFADCNSKKEVKDSLTLSAEDPMTKTAA